MKTLILYLIFAVVLISCNNKQKPQTIGDIPVENENIVNANNALVIDATKDAEYMMNTYANVLYTIKAAEVVKEKSNRPDIKAVAQKIEKTNREVFRDLDQLASAKKISLPSKLSMAQLNELNKLSSNNENLEKAFLDQMEMEHKEGMDLLEKISKESEDNQISTVAIACYSAVKSQYDEVVAVKQRLEL